MDEEAQISATFAGPKAAGYLWQVPGKPVSVKFEFDVIDRILEEVMRGFGLVPRKFVEVGGILLGSVERNGQDRCIVTVTDFEPVACSHARGLSWLLTEQETMSFEETALRWSVAAGRRTYAVGMLRSHGREGLALAPEDVELYDRYLPQPWAIALLVRPFATQVSTGAVFFRENGEGRSKSSYLEFPFRRKELGGGEAETDWPQRPAARVEDRIPMAIDAPETQAPAVASTHVPPAKPVEGSGGRSRWLLVPIAVVCLLLGGVGGFQLAVRLPSLSSAVSGQEPYALNLSVSPSGDSTLHVRWDRTAPAIQAAGNGTLHIRDGANEKQITLDAAQLRNGSVVYRRASSNVTFRLEVVAKSGVTIAETVRFKGQ